MKSSFSKSRKRTAIVVIACMIMTMIPGLAFGLEASDISGHWAEEKIQSWIDQELIKGYEDGTFKPENNITRAEFMTLVNGAFDYTETEEISFSDVAEDAWYAEAVKKAKAAGYITGYPDNTMRPDSPISREEAATIITGITQVEGNPEGKTSFTDDKSLSWSRDAVAAVSETKIMNGYPDGSFMPQNLIKRGEAVVALDGALSYSKASVIYDEAGTYGPAVGTTEVEGDVIVLVKDVTLRNMVVKGNLIVSKNVGDGDVTLDSVTVKGESRFYGGGENSIIIIDSTLGNVTIYKENDKIRIVISGSTTVEGLEVNSGAIIETSGLTGSNAGFQEIILDADEDDVIVLRGTFGQVDVQSAGIEVQVPSGSTVNNLILNGATDVTGTGTITNAQVNAGGVSFETEPKKVETATGITPPVIEAPAPVVSGGGGGGSTSVAVSAISVNKTAVTLAVGATETLVVTFDPTNATNKNVTWTTSDEGVATVANGVVTAVGEGTATITATSNNGKTATCAVTVEEALVVEYAEVKAATESDLIKDGYTTESVKKVNYANLEVVQDDANVTITGKDLVKVTQADFPLAGFGDYTIPTEGISSTEFALIAWMVGEEPHIWIIGDATKTFNVTWDEVEYTIDVEGLNWGVEPIESEATITLDGEEDYTNEGYDNEITLADGKVTGTLAYHEEDPTGMGFGDYEHHFMVFKVAGLADGATVTIEGKENGVESITTYTLTKESEVFVWGVEEGEDTITITVDKDGAGEAYTAKTYTLDLSEVTLEKAPVEPIESEATITLDGEEDYTNEGYDNEITLADGKVTGTLAYHEEDPTGMGFGDYEHHFMVFKVAGLADGATVTIEGKENGVESITTYTLTKESEVFVWGVEEGEDTITITVDKDGAGEAYTAKTYTLDLSEVTLEKAPVEPIESEATITLDGEEDYTNEGYDNEITLADGKVTGTLAYHEEDPTGMGFGDYEHHFMVFKVAGLADGATVTIEGKENGVESITTYTLTKESEVFVWGVEEGEDTITITVDKDGAGEAYTAKTYTLDLSEVTLEKAPVEPIESEATITLDGEEDYTNEGYDNEITLADGKVTGTLAYHEEDPTGMGFGDYEHHFMVFKVAGLADGATVTIEGKENGVESITTYTLTKESEVFVWGVEEGEDTITITVDKDGAGEAYTAKTYTLDLSEVTLEKAPVEPIESEATITLDGEEDYTNEGYDNEITLADGKVTGTLAYHEEDPTGMGFGDYEHHFMVFKVAGLADGATVTIEGKENGVESITTYTLTKESEVFVWGVEEGEDTITITVDKDGAGEAYTAKTYTLDLSEVTLEKAPVEPIESEATITLDGEEDYTNEGYDNEITLADGKVTGTLAYHEEDPTGMGFGDYEHHFMVFKVAGLADGATVTIEGKENGVESITTYTLTKESEVFVWGVEEGEDTITITVDKDGAGEAYTAKTYTLDLSEVTLEKAPVEPIESEATITLDGEEDYTNEGYDNEITLADGKVTGTLAYHEEDPTGMGFGDYEHHFMVFKVAGLADGATVTIEGKENGVESITTYTLTKESEVFVWGVEEGEDTITITVDKDGAGEAYTAKTYTLDLSEVTLEKAPVEPIESEATITLDGEEDYTNEGYDNEITLADGKVTGTLAYHEEDPTGMGFGDYEHHFMVFKVAGLADGATVTIEGKENGVESITTYTLTKESEVFVWGVEEGEDTITITVDKDGAGEAYTAKTYTLDLSEVTLEKAPVEPIESEATITLDGEEDYTNEGYDNEITLADGKVTGTLAYHEEDPTGMGFGDYEHHFMVFKVAGLADGATVTIEGKENGVESITTYTLTKESEVFVWGVEEGEDTITITVDKDGAGEAYTAKTYTLDLSEVTLEKAPVEPIESEATITLDGEEDYTNEGYDNEITLADGKVTGTLAYHEEDPTGMGFGDYEHHFMVFKVAGLADGATVTIEGKENGVESITTYTLTKESEVFVWGVEEGEDTITITVDKDGAGEAYTAKTYTLDLSEVTLEKAPVEPIESEATITLDGEEDYTNEGYDNEITLADGKVTGTLAYHEEDPTGMGFGDYEHHFMVFKVAGLADGATVTIEGKENGVESITTYTLTKESEVFVWGVEEGEDTITITVDKDGAGEAYTAKTYTLDLSEVTLEKAPVEPIESEATITLDGEEDYTNEGYDNEITLADGKVTGTLAYHEEDPTGMGFGDYEHHFMVFKVAGLADGATVTIEGKENGVESITTYTLTKESEVFVWGVEEGEDTITITVDKDGAGEAYTAKTYTLDLSEVTLEKAPVEPIESEATITLDGEEDYTNEGYDNEITLADGKVTGTLAYHEEDPTGMGFGDYEHHFMVFKVAGLADGATVTIEGKENGVESITTYTLTKESEVFVWGVEEGEDTITITVDKDGAGEAYTAKTYTLDLSEVTLEKAPVEPIESEATITLDGEEDYTNEGYDNEITLADGKVTGTLAYHEEDPTGMGFGDYEHHFMVFKVAGLADGATVTIEGKENGVESITTYTLTKESEVFVWGVEEGEDTITITVDKDGAGEAYTAKTYTLDLSEVTLEKAPVEPIESEATITLDGEEDYTNEGYDNEITLADGKVTGTLAYHEEDPTGMGFGDYEHHFMVFKVAGLADGATVTIEGKENGVESITTYTLTKESEVFVWGVEEGEDTITITVDKDGAGEAYTAKTYTLDLSEVTLEKAPVEPIESEATITLDGEEDYTNEGYDNEITLADGKVTGTLAYHEEDPTGMGFGDYEHHFMVFKVAGLADGATVTIEGKENGVESITTYTLTKESEVFVWGVEEGEDTITITVDKDGAGEAYTAKTYTLDLSEVTLEKAPVEPIESEATITLDGEEDYTNEGYDNEITLADGKVTGTLAYHEEDPTGMGFGDYEHHFMVFKVAGLADGATVTIEGKENGVESITTYTLTKESEVFVWGVEEGEDTITITVDKDGAGEAYTAKTYTLDLSEVTLEKAPVEPIESEATITLDGEEDYTNEGYDNEITLADGKVTGTLAYHEEDPTGMGFGDYEHHFMVFKVAGLADGATVTIEGKENGVESITTYTLTKESEVFVWGVEEGEDTITITVDKDGAGEAYTAKTYTLDLSEVTLEKAPVEPIESEATITLDGEEDYTNEGYDNEITLADGKVTGTLAYHEEDPTGMGFGDYEHHFMVFKVAGLADGATVTIEGKENGVESITTYTLTKESEVFVWGVEEGEDTITITVDKDGAGEAYTAKTYTLDLSEVTLEKAPVEPIESEATITLDGEEDYTNEGYDNEITLADGKVTGTLAYHEEDPTGMGFGDYEHHFMVFKVAGLADGATVTIEGKENGVESITTYTLTKESEVFVWGVEEGEDTITITVDKDGAGEAYTAKTYTLDLSEVTLEKAPVEPIESEATITLDGEEDYTNEGYDNEITLADGKVTGTLAYHEEDPTGMGFGDYEHHFMVFKVAGLADGATVTIEGKENGVESITTYTLTKESEVFVWGVEEGEDTITITVDKDGAGEAYTAKTYTLDLSEVTLEKAPVEPIESEATITLDGEEDYTNEGYDNEITLADGKVTGTLAYHEEDPTGMGFGDYEHHFMVFKVAGLADGATVTIEGKENGVESITTYTLTKESEVFVWGVEEGEDTITITVDKDGAGEAYTAKTYTLDLSEVTLEKAPVEPIESEATITLDGEEDYTNEGYDNEITLADGKVTGTLAYHEEDPTGMGFGDYEHHFMVFKVAGLADGATVTIEGKENGVESITTYTLTKESEVFVWGVEEGEDTITITVDKDGAGEAYTAKTYTLDLSEVTLEKAPVEPIESEATITLDGEEDYTNEGYDNEITLADGKVTGTLAYHEEDPTGMGFGDYEHHFMVFKVAGLADGATVTIEGKENGVESITTYTLTKESEVFVWGVEEGEDTITITVDKDGAGEAYTAKTYTLDLSEVTLEKAPVEPIESEATITLDGEEDYTNEGYDNEITLADGKVTGTLAYHEEDPTGMGFGDYEHHFMVFKVAGLADGATVTIEGKENGVESITTYTLTKESEVFVWGVEEGEDTITITVDKDGAGEAYTAKTYTLDLSEVTLEKAPVEPIESEATITLDGEEDYTNEGYDNEITLADGKVTGTLAYHEEDPTGMGFGDYEHHFMVFKVAGLADGATVTIEGKENGVESITTYTLTKESEVFVWGVEEGEDTITITVDKDGAGEAYTAKTYTLDLSEVTLEKAPVEPIESEATITLDGEEDYTNEGYDNEITLADGKVTGTLAYHEEDPTGMGFGDYEHHFMVFKVAGLADGATVTIEGKENGVESITTYTLTKESEVFVWGVEEGEDTITITVDKDGAGEAYTAKTYTLDLSEVTLEKAPVEPIESEATITLDGEEDYTNEGYDNEITLADGKVTGTLAYHEEDPTGMGFGDYEHHFMVFKVAGLADGATVTIEGKENGVESITTYTLTKESEVFVWGVEEGEDTITITVDKDGAGEAYTAKTYTLDLSEVTLEKAPVEPIESEATITLDGEEDYTNEGYDNEITLADGKVTGTLAYHEEDPTGMGFGDYEHHFMVFKVAGLADGATVTIEGKENGVESITTYTLTKESEVFVWGVEEGEDTITITVDKDGAGEAYTAKTYTLDLSEVTLEKAPVEPIESEATITLDGEEDYTNEGYDNEITLADGKVTGTLAYHEEDPTGMGFGDYEHHFMVFKVAGLADGATVTIEGKENGVESITTYTLTKESEVFVWGVEEGEDTITITVDKDGAGEAYTAKTYTLDLSEVTLEKAPVEPIESEATITLDGEEDYTNEGYDNEITLADGKVTGTLAYHEEDPTGMGFGDYEHHFMVFKVAGLADGATVTIEGKENGVESITTYTLTKESEVFVWGVEEGEDTITITVDKDGAGEAYTAKTYTLDLSEVTLEKAPVEPIESEATITLDGEEDYTNEGYDNEITLADGKVTGTLAYHEEDPTGMGFGDYEHHFMVFKVAGLADGATVTIEGKENGVESITTYTLTKESEVFVWGVEEGEDTITITVDKDGAGEAYTAKTYTLDLSEVTLEKAPVEPIESEATITLDGEEDYTNEGYDNEITLADGKVTGTLAYHEEDPTGMGFGDYEHHFMVFKVAGLADGATVTIEGKENGVESITTYTLTKESEVFVWGVEEGEDTITITVDKDGAGEAYTAKTYTLDLSEVTLEKAPVEPIESEATITLDGEEDYTNEGYDNEITLADGKVTGTLAYHEEDPTGMGFGDYEHHFMVFKVAGLADGATVTIEGKENGVESITTYTLTKESEVFVWGVEEGEDTITITVDKDGAGEAYTAKTYTLDLSEVTLEKAPVEPIESEATITLDGEEDYTNEGYDNEITLADGKVTGTLAYHEEDPTGMGFGDYEHHFMVFKVAGLADGATVTIEGKENGVESITTYTLTKESEVFVWGVEEGEDTITITVDKDGAGEAYTAKTYTLDLSEVTLEKAPVEPIESEATITLDGEEDYTNEGYDNEITLADGKVTGTLAYHEEDPTGMGFGDYEHHFMVFKVAGLADGATVTIEGKENGVESITTYTLTKESEVFVWGVEEGEDTITITVDKDGAGEAYTAKTYTLDLSEVTLEKAPVEPIESEATITLDGEEDYTNEGYDNEITLADGKVTGTLAYHEEDPTGMGFGDYEHHFMVFKVAGLADGATVTIEGKENGVESITTYTLTKESEVFVWGVEEGEDTITITVDKDGAGEAYTAKTYTLDLSEVTLEKAPVEPIESEATITLDGEEDYTNEGYDNEITLADGKVTGTLAYHEEDPTGMGFGDYEHHFMVFKVAGLADGATVTIEGKENGVESITTYTLTKESEVFVWGVEEGEDTITITVDKDGAGEAYTAKTYTLDLSEVTLEKAPVEPIESEATITLDGEEDYTNEGYDNEITLADGKVTGTLAYHEEDPTGMGFGDYEHHFMVFKVAGLADGATVTIEGKENGVESITTYTLTKESEVFVWGVEEGEDTITITVDKDGAGEAYTAKTYTLDLSEVTLEKAPVEPIESEATITLDGEEDYTNEGYDNEITLADGKVTGTLAYHEEDPTGMGFGDYEHHFMVFKVAGLADGATVTIEGKENGVESITTYTLTKESEVFVWGVEEGEDTITITVDKDGAGEAYTAKTYTLDLSEVTLEKAPVEPIFGVKSIEKSAEHVTKAEGITFDVQGTDITIGGTIPYQTDSILGHEPGNLYELKITLENVAKDTAAFKSVGSQTNTYAAADNWMDGDDFFYFVGKADKDQDIVITIDNDGDWETTADAVTYTIKIDAEATLETEATEPVFGVTTIEKSGVYVTADATTLATAENTITIGGTIPYQTDSILGHEPGNLYELKITLENVAKDTAAFKSVGSQTNTYAAADNWMDGDDFFYFVGKADKDQDIVITIDNDGDWETTADAVTYTIKIDAEATLETEATEPVFGVTTIEKSGVYVTADATTLATAENTITIGGTIPYQTDSILGHEPGNLYELKITLENVAKDTAAFKSVGSQTNTYAAADNWMDGDDFFYFVGKADKDQDIVITIDNDGDWETTADAVTYTIKIDAEATLETEVVAPVVEVISISVSPTTMTLKVGETGKITATIEPDNATNKKVNWSTSDENVVTVAANGTVATVTAVAEGTATITVKSEDGGFAATTTVTVEAAPEVGTKAEFLAELDTETAKLAPVATVTRDGESLTVNFRSDVEPSDVLDAAVGLAEALGNIADPTSTLTVGDITITLGSATPEEIIELATALLGGKTPAEFLAAGETITSAYTASIDYKGGTFDLDGSLNFTVTKVGTKAEFLDELDEATEDLEVATVTRDGDNLTVNFRSDVEPSDVLDAAVGLAEALGNIADPTSTLTVGDITITLGSATSEEIIELATALLGGKTPAEFLAAGETITSAYTASIDYKGGTFDLDGSLNFTVTKVGTKAEFLDELDEATEDLEVATVTRDGDNLTVNFRSDVEPSDVLDAAVGLAEALGNIADPTSTLTVGDITITLGSATSEEIIELATALLGGKTPAEFLAAGETITSAYTASIDYKGGTFDLDGSLNFTVTKVGTKAEFLDELDEATEDLEVATVTRDGDNLTVNFRSDVEPSDVLDAAVGLAEALGNIADPTSTLTVGDITITLGSATSEEIIELATALLGGKTPAEFLAAGETITSAYTASIDYKGGTFDLDGSLNFTVTKVGTKAEFLDELDEATEDLEVATVTRDGDNLTVNFRSDVEPSDVLDAAVGLAEALGNIADPTSTLTVGDITITLGSATSEEIIELATALLGGKTPAEFLAAGETITSAYTASIDYKGGTFDLDGTISFTAVQ